MIDQIHRDTVRFGPPPTAEQDGLGPAAGSGLAVPESWDPFPAGHLAKVDVIFWNTGFRAALRHLAPMRLRSRGGIELLDEVTPAADPRILLVGYGSTASTVGATRAGRLAGRKAWRRLSGR